MEHTSYKVDESSGVVLLCVRMLGQSSLFSTAVISTKPGTAGRHWPQLNTDHSVALMVTDSPSDFSSISHLLTFEPFSSHNCIAVDIVDDATVENAESFTVVLSRTSGLDSRVELRQQSSVIQITDDDTSKKCICKVE